MRTIVYTRPVVAPHWQQRCVNLQLYGGKEGHRLEDWGQFGRDLDFVIFVQVENGVQVPLRAELGHRQEAGGETSDLEEAGCRVFRDTVVQKNIENWKHK